MFVVVVIKYVL